MTGETKSSTRYEMFNINTANRPVEPAKVKRLKNRIEEKNLLREFPIVVKETENGLEILDGQHRFQAAKELGKEIFYIESEHMDLEDVPMVNMERSNWISKDFLHHYVRKDLSDYKQFKHFMDKYEFPISACMSLLSDIEKRDRARNYDLFRSGHFTIGSYRKAQQIAETVWAFKDIFPDGFKKRSFIMAITYLVLKCQNFNHEYLIDKIKKNGLIIERRPGQSMYVQQLERLYNYRSHKKVRFI